MKEKIYYIRVKDTNEKHAGNKAVSDCNEILKRTGGQPIYISSVQNKNKWISKGRKFIQYLNLFKIQKGSIVYIQHPMYINPRYMKWIAAVKKIKKIKVIFIIHDLESLRKLFVNETEKYEYLDNMMIKLGDAYIAHNACMIKYMTERWGVSPEKIINLQIFDYLLKKNAEKKMDENYINGIIVAGNLSREKSGYIYNLDVNDIPLIVYGNGLDQNERKSNFIYKGSFTPEELPYYLEGKFGLVWDGPNIKTCDGTVGNYLRYNNPHKVSLYLSAGIPVIIWNQAALADFVKRNKVGIVVDSLENIENYIKNIDENKYNEMKENALKISGKLRSGFYLNKAIQEANTVV